jgi:cytochrome c biogenesis factor
LAELGELCLWASLPLVVLAAAMSIAAGVTGRGDAATLGGRAMVSAAGLLLVSLIGLGHALVNVKLQYAFVAAYSGFQVPWYWRLAALWSVPAGAVLVLTLLVTLAGVVSSRLGRSRFDAARTGALAVLAIIGATTVIASSQPFLLLEVPAQFGTGLPSAARDLAWQIEVAAIDTAIACGAFAMAGIIGEQVTDALDLRGTGHAAMTAAAGLLTLAIFAAAWRVYGASGRLLDVASFSWIAVYLPVWLLAFAYLHAPGGPAVPMWAEKWTRTLGVAFFPAAVGAGAATVAGMGEVPQATLWAGGLAVGILSGAVSGMAHQPARAESLKRVPGFGVWAFQAGTGLLLAAGLVCAWGLTKAPAWSTIAWPLVFLGLAATAAWSVARPAGTWKRIWPAAVLLFAIAAGGAYVATGARYPEVGLATGLAAAAGVGFLADVVRLRRVGRTTDPVGTQRSRRRWSSAVAHLGIATLVIGLSAGTMAEVRTQTMSPGDSIRARSGLSGEVTVTYLGLSRYQVGALDKRVASFSLFDGRDREMKTAAITQDLASRRQSRTGVLKRGLFNDVSVGIAGVSGADDDIVANVASRPLTSLVWLGGLLILVSVGLRRKVIA